ncbi:MAG TPA: prepilin-type N-terminal cleavage/methylation domain-containing protein [Rhodanobacteraceae bacterium]|nr:prepilin-type N-terminal cleavage/methylation domain-containing protein [Rhodanobacteraceae bacterium]
MIGTRDSGFRIRTSRGWGLGTRALCPRSFAPEQHTTSETALGGLRVLHADRFSHPSPQPAPSLAFQSGFTLLEVLFALVLMAFAMVAVWGALRTGARLTRSADLTIQQSDRVRAVQQYLRGYLGGAQPQAYVPGPNQSARMFEGSPQKITWVAPMPAQLGDGGLFVQTLQLVRKKDAHDYVLQLGYSALSSDTVVPPPAKPELLLDGVADGQFEYLVVGRRGEPARWQDTWESTSGLPLAVRIAIRPGWAGRIGFPEMLIPLRAGNGQGRGEPSDPGAAE